MKKLALASILLTQFIAQFASAASPVSGVERRLFTLEKSYNPENILIIHATTDDNCKFVKQNKEYVNYFWLMDKKNRKELNALIYSSVHDRVTFQAINDTKDSFKVTLNDLKEIKHDLDDPRIEVTSEIENGECSVKSIIKLGATAQYRTINLNRVYCDVETNMFGIPKGCKFLDLQGTDVNDGKSVKVRFKAKK